MHCHVEYLLDEMKKVDACVESNQLYLALGLIRSNTNALPVGVCLLWSVIGRILSMEITMHRYREFKELAGAMGSQANFSLAQMNSAQLSELSALLESINRVLELVVLNNNDQLKEAGYPDHLFQMRHVDVDSMLSWASSLLYQVHFEGHWIGEVSRERTRAIIQSINHILYTHIYIFRLEIR